MRLLVIQTGRVRDPHVIAMRDEFVKRFSRFGTLTVIERQPKGDRPLWPESARLKVALDQHGEQFTSEQFAARLQDWTVHHGELAFLVGEGYGHHPPSLAAADRTLSLGSLVLPHQLAHLVLVEQLYRAATIHAGLPYHHGG